MIHTCSPSAVIEDDEGVGGACSSSSYSSSSSAVAVLDRLSRSVARCKRFLGAGDEEGEDDDREGGEGGDHVDAEAAGSDSATGCGAPTAADNGVTPRNKMAPAHVRKDGENSS